MDSIGQRDLLSQNCGSSKMYAVVVIRSKPPEVEVEVLQHDYLSVQEAENFRFRYLGDRICDPINVKVIEYRT